MANLKDKIKQGPKSLPVSASPPVVESPKPEKPKNTEEKKSKKKKSFYEQLTPIAKVQLKEIIGGRLIQWKKHPKNNNLTLALWDELTDGKVHPRETLEGTREKNKYLKEFGWN
jgi:hypothetical protein